MIKLKNKVSIMIRENPNSILESTKALQKLVRGKSAGVLRSVRTSKVMNKYGINRFDMNDRSESTVHVDAESC